MQQTCSSHLSTVTQGFLSRLEYPRYFSILNTNERIEIFANQARGGQNRRSIRNTLLFRQVQSCHQNPLGIDSRHDSSSSSPPTIPRYHVKTGDGRAGRWIRVVFCGNHGTDDRGKIPSSSRWFMRVSSCKRSQSLCWRSQIWCRTCNLPREHGARRWCLSREAKVNLLKKQASVLKWALMGAIGRRVQAIFGTVIGGRLVTNGYFISSIAVGMIDMSQMVQKLVSIQFWFCRFRPDFWPLFHTSEFRVARGFYRWG